MESKLILDVTPRQISIALTEDGRLVEFSRESREATFSVGNVYLAKVKKVMPGLNAAFVDVGFEKDAFLHYLDLGLYFSSSQQFLSSVLTNRKKQPKLIKPLKQKKPKTLSRQRRSNPVDEIHNKNAS